MILTCDVLADYRVFMAGAPCGSGLPLTNVWLDLGGKCHDPEFFKNAGRHCHWSRGSRTPSGIPNELPQLHALALLHPETTAKLRPLLRYDFGHLMSGFSFRCVETLPVEPLLTQEEARAMRKNLWSPDQLNDQLAAKIAERPDVIFEKHGFIWGGKWYHYDTMHFEYRPELLPEQTQ
jgi:hypothetical protein